MQGPNQVGQGTKQSVTNEGHGNKEICCVLNSNNKKTEFLD